MTKILSVFLSLFFLVGCGYKPSSYYLKQEIGKKVFVNLDINIDNASNSVLIKDAMNEMLVSRFGSKLVYTKDEADTVLNLALGSVSLSQIQYDQQGYVKVYRTTVSINANYKTDGKKRVLTLSDYYDFSVDEEAVISDSKKEEAVKIAARKALEKILSKIAIQSFQK